MIFDVLIAAKGTLFRPSWRAAGDEIRRLVVAEACEGGVLTGKIVIQANVPSAFIEFPHGLIDIVEGRVAYHIRRRIKLNHFGTDRIDQRRRNDVASLAGCLYPVRRVYRLRSISAGQTLEGDAAKRVRELRSKRIVAEIVITICVGRRHASGRNKTIERHPFTLHFGLIVNKEERLVLPNRAAQRTAKLVQIEFFHRGCEVAARIEIGVAEELKQRAVKLV